MPPKPNRRSSQNGLEKAQGSVLPTLTYHASVRERTNFYFGVVPICTRRRKIKEGGKKIMAETAISSIASALVAEIVGSYVSKNKVAPADIPTLIATVHQSLVSLGKSAEPEQPRTPAVPIRRSVNRDYVVCLECGWRANTLRRHLQVRHGLNPQDYRGRWKLAPDHPITAPAYSERRSALAKQLGLGQKRIG